jgi:hypothetical protein
MELSLSFILILRPVYALPRPSVILVFGDNALYEPHKDFLCIFDSLYLNKKHRKGGFGGGQ